jgi:hypothetical protein
MSKGESHSDRASLRRAAVLATAGAFALVAVTGAQRWFALLAPAGVCLIAYGNWIRSRSPGELDALTQYRDAWWRSTRLVRQEHTRFGGFAAMTVGCLYVVLGIGALLR